MYGKLFAQVIRPERYNHVYVQSLILQYQLHINILLKHILP